MSEKKDDKGSELVGITPVGRVTFCHIWEPHAFDKDKTPNYGMVLVFDNETDIEDLKKLAIKAAKKKWGDETKAKVKNKKWAWPWRDANDYSKYGEPFDKGGTMINVKSNSAPGVVDAKAKAIKVQSDFYSGCLARCSVYAHAYDTMGNIGVTFLLNNVQKAGDGDRLADTRANPEDEFDALVDSTDNGDELNDLL